MINNNDLGWITPRSPRASRRQGKDLSIRINKSGKSAMSLVFRFHNAAHLRIDSQISRAVFALDPTTDRLYFDSASYGYAVSPAKHGITLKEAENTQFIASASTVEHPEILVGEYTLLYDSTRRLYYVDLVRD